MVRAQRCHLGLDGLLHLAQRVSTQEEAGREIKQNTVDFYGFTVLAPFSFFLVQGKVT